MKYCMFLAFIVSYWILGSCTPDKPVRFHFYHWKLENIMAEDSFTSAALQRFPVEDIYLHIMDVSWNAASGMPVPRALISIQESAAVLKKKIVPVIFIENEVLKKIDEKDIDSFAGNIISARESFIKNYLAKGTDELQIDCDWTKETRERYFQLLQSIKRQGGDLLLSVTIRLYPYKYSGTMGVPPVDYGVLMCYNMDKIRSRETRNSILDTDLLQQYLDRKPYPLKVKAALPVFGWYVWFRNETYHSILYLPPAFSSGTIVNSDGDNRLRMLRDTVIGTNYLRAGDVLRNEFITGQQVEASIQLLIHNNKDIEDIIFYHWDKQLITNYEPVLQKTFDHFHKPR